MHAVSKIVDASDPTGDDIVIEIGPGKGVITERLLHFAGKVIAIETDERMVHHLAERFSEYCSNGHLDIVHGDILDFDECIMNQYSHPYTVVGNIPYYITGAIIRKFLSSTYQPSSMTLLIQKEVAERIVCRNGKHSILSLAVAIYGKAHYIAKVPRRYFSPAPRVDSAIIHIDEISRDRLNGINEELFFTVVKTGFGQKRKKLINNLSTLYEKEYLLSIFEKLSIDPNTRAEDVPLTTWINIVCLLNKVNKEYTRRDL